MTDYIPSRESELSTWANNFAEKVGTYAKDLGFSPADVESLQNACVAIADGITSSMQAQKAAQMATENKTKAIVDSLVTIRTEVGRGKKAPGYTDAIGKDLGVIATGDKPDLDTYKTALSAEVFPGHVTVKFTKKGVQGINVYVRLKGENGWTKLAYDTFSPYVDNRPLGTPGVAETREYMGIGVVHDTEVGQMSDIVQVVFGG